MTTDPSTPDPKRLPADRAADPAEARAILLTALALDELSEAERADVEASLETAEGRAQRRELDHLRRLAAALRAAAPAGTDRAGARAAVETALGRGPAVARVAAPRPVRHLLWLAPVGMVAASVAALVMLFQPPAARQVALAPQEVAARKRLAGQVPIAADVEGVEVMTVTVPTAESAAAPAPADGAQPAPPPVAEPAPVASPPPAEAFAFRRAEDRPRGNAAPLGIAGGPAAVDSSGGLMAGNPVVSSGALRARAADETERARRESVLGRDSKHPGAIGGMTRAAGERYARFVENPFQDPATAPLSTFSIDVDTASYTIVRRFLTAGERPPADAVRLEELINYFRYADPAPPADGDPFAVRLETADCPWRSGHRLVRVGIKGREIAAADRPAGNLVFLVDVSGSMRDADKLPLVKEALGMLVDRLREDDTVSIVTYAGDAGLKLPAAGGHDAERIRRVIDGLEAGGSTHGSAGIELAYDEAKKHFVPGGANRVILCTDGDLNVGVTDDEELVALIRQRAREGTFLTVLGFGRGNLQDEKMEKLADNGNGVYAYVDSAREARKVLVEQLTGSTVTIAKDVKLQVEFNPARVAAWRLLGYENRALAARDFADDTKDAGEIGAGHGVTALYEYLPAGSPDGAALPELRYRSRPAAPPSPAAGDPAARELLTLKLRFKAPHADESVLREIPLVDAGGSFDSASADLRFASAVAAFGMLLRSSEHSGTASLGMVATIARTALGDDPGGLRAEFLDLVRRAEALAPPARQ